MEKEVTFEALSNESYVELQSWGAVAPRDFYPVGGSWFCLVDGKKVVFGTVQFTNTPIAYAEGFLADLSLSVEERLFALGKLVEFGSDLAKRHGFKLFVCLSSNPVEARYFRKFGFQVVSEKLVYSVRNLCL